MQAASWVGGKFGRFEVRRTLGEGGMGAVFLAFDPKRSEEVALKLYFSPEDRKAAGLSGECELDAPEFRRSFIAPDGIPSRIRLPGVVPILEAGIEDERLWYTMPFVSGGDFWERLAKGPIAPEEAARLMAQAARALHAVHERGVVHRDIKPGNLLVDPSGNVLLADFGMAKLVGRKCVLSSDGMGTPAYMPPEQASGSADLDVRSDVYSLGAVLYEALCGSGPHSGTTTEEIIESIFVCDPVPPSGKKEGVPPELERICLRALEKEKVDRFPSALAMAEALEAWVRGDPPPPERRRRPWVAWAVVAGVLALGVAAFAAWPSEPSGSSALVRLAERELRTNGNPSRAEQLLTEALRQDPSLRDAYRLRAEARQALGDAPGAAADEAQARAR